MPARVLLFNCEKQVAASRFVDRARAANDTIEMFEKRHAEFEANNRLILELYPELVIEVRSSVTLLGRFAVN